MRSPLSIFQICLLVITFAVGVPVEAAKVGVKLDELSNSRLSEIKANPEEIKLKGENVYRFRIEHGACGVDTGWSDCDSDRQRIEVKDGYKISLQTFSKEQNLERYYRTHLLIPSESMFPDTSPMKTMIHQTKLHNKNQPIWFVGIQPAGGLYIQTDSAGFCSIDRQFVPRDEWLEIEIHANYEQYSSEKLELAQEAILRSRAKNFQARVTPSFRYFINGKEVCTLWNPLITTAGLRDGDKRKLQLKFGIYNTAASRWLLAQRENQQWVDRNDIKFTGYQQHSKGQRNGAVQTKIASPFDYDWPVKLPTQTLYYTDWYMTKDAANLPPSRYQKTKVKSQPEGCSDPVFAKMMGTSCD